MEDRTTKCSTTVVWRATIAGVFNGDSEIHADTKSHEGTIHIKILSIEEQIVH